MIFQNSHEYANTYPLQGVLQQLYGIVDGLLRDIGGLSVPLDFQECHLQQTNKYVDILLWEITQAILSCILNLTSKAHMPNE